jgi:hypothetical protein
MIFNGTIADDLLSGTKEDDLLRGKAGNDSPLRIYP